MPRLTLIEGGGEGSVEQLLPDDFLKLVSGEPRPALEDPPLSWLRFGERSPDPILSAISAQLDLALRRIEALTTRLEDKHG